MTKRPELPFVQLPVNDPIVSLQTLSKKIYPKWMFWKPRITYLYAATKNAIYEVDVSTVTVVQSFKNKLKARYFTVKKMFPEFICPCDACVEIRSEK